MDREVRAEFDEIRSILRETAELGRATDRRMDRAEKRMEKFDQQLQAMRKPVEAGIKIVSHLAADTRELKRSQKAFLDSLRNSGNGRRHA
jgi:hypothetical protein